MCSANQPAIAALRFLIERFLITPPLSPRDAQRLADARLFDWGGDNISPEAQAAHFARYRARAFDLEPTHGEHYGKQADQDLEWNVLFLGRLFDDWLANAHGIPPHWANRICVLLRKSKLLDMEREFLAAFMPHYATPFINTENSALMARAAKVRAYPKPNSKTP